MKDDYQPGSGFITQRVTELPREVSEKLFPPPPSPRPVVPDRDDSPHVEIVEEATNVRRIKWRVGHEQDETTVNGLREQARRQQLRVFEIKPGEMIIIGKLQNELHIVDGANERWLRWTPGNRLETERATQTFNKGIADGWHALAVRQGGGHGRRINTFDPNEREILLTRDLGLEPKPDYVPDWQVSNITPDEWKEKTK